MKQHRVFVFLITIVALATPSRPEGEEEPWPVLLGSPDVAGRERGARIVEAEYAETVRALLVIVRKPLEEKEPFYISATSRNTAIRLLARLRAADAVADLVQWITPREGQAMTMTELMRFGPAGNALVQIGLPSVPKLLERLEAEGFTDAGTECLKLIVEIKGRDEADVFFRRQLDQDPTDRRREIARQFLKLFPGERR
jgi:hypothetical protein